MKLAIASLTIGSGSAAVVLADRELSRTGNRLLNGMVRTNTYHHRLCHSGHDEAVGDGMRPLMQTDSERLMREGVAVASEAFDHFLAELGWLPEQIDKTFCHQIGVAHRKMMFERLGLNTQIDFSTVEYLGNTGSVALPMTAAIGIERGQLQPLDRVAMLGIGSGINVVMLGVEWQKSLAKSTHSNQLQKPSTAAI
jgi:3-oxoacyl-[acyl-carrier-protein] synthase-3